MSSTHEPKAGHASLDLPQLARMLARRKWLLLLPWAAATLAGVAAAFLLQPIYFSGVKLRLERATKLAGPLGGIVGDGSAADQQAEVMRSQVQSSLFLRGVITASGVLSDPATRAWAKKESRVATGASEDEALEGYLVEYLRQAVSVRRERGDVFTIIVGDFAPKRAQRLAESVANQFVISSKAAQIEAVRATQEFSVEQQQIYKRKLEEAVARLEAAKRASIATSVAGSAINPNNLLLARTLTDQAQMETEDQRGRVAELRSQFGGRVRDNDPVAISTPESNALVAQLSGLERQLAASMLTGAGDGPVRLAIARKVAELEIALQTSAASALPGLAPDARDLVVRYRLAQADLQSKEGRRAYLAGQIAQYESQVVSGPDRDLSIARLQQDVDNAQTLYNSFLTQSVASQISEAFENARLSGRFSVLEPANLPTSPGKPNRPVLILLAFLAGAMVGVGAVVVVEQHDQSMKDADEVENLLGLPVLGAVPRVEELERDRRRPRGTPGLPAPRDAGLLQRLQVESSLGLEFRRIYLNLARARARAMPRTLLVTSATRGEGKTTTSACLGITLAREMRERLLVVDFDLRSPALHRALGIPSSSWGLAQMLQQRNFDERFIRGTVLPHLDFLPAGKSERPAGELLDHDGIEWFLKEASARYPYVLIDSAPNLAVPDSLILGRMVEGVLYVIKAGSTVRKAAEYGVRVQREANDNVLGVLLNDAGEILPTYYGYRTNYYGYSTEAMGGES